MRDVFIKFIQQAYDVTWQMGNVVLVLELLDISVVNGSYSQYGSSSRRRTPRNVVVSVWVSIHGIMSLYSLVTLLISIKDIEAA